MASITSPSRGDDLNFTHETRNSQSYNTDYEDTNENSRSSMKKLLQTFSYDESIQSPKTSNNRIRHLYSRLKRRLTLTKEHRTRSEQSADSVSERPLVRLKNYKAFSSTVEESSNDIEWPDFETVYDSIPTCLINALHGLDEFPVEKKSDDSNFETDESSIDTMNLFLQCKRGNNFRRNAICLKVDKAQYHGQLDTFIQQLMVEKLMRTWT
jgi:hypothetical protein